MSPPSHNTPLCTVPTPRDTLIPHALFEVAASPSAGNKSKQWASRGEARGMMGNPGGPGGAWRQIPTEKERWGGVGLLVSAGCGGGV